MTQRENAPVSLVSEVRDPEMSSPAIRLRVICGKLARQGVMVGEPFAKGGKGLASRQRSR